MAKKKQPVKPTIRTLKDTGEQVVHHQATDEFPQGRQVLVPTNKMAERLTGMQEDIADANAVLVERHLQAVAEKRARQTAHPAIPADKSVL